MSDENKDRLPDSELSGEDLNRAIRTGEEFSQWLKGIAGDLWSSDGIIPSRPLKPAGAPAGSRTPERPAARPAPNASSAAPAPQKSAGKPVQGKEKEEQKVEREPLNRLWRTADETIDWTDALAMDRPTDGLTPQREWDFYHRMAGRVLEGEINAYIEVLQTINPLGDLRDYVNGMVIRTPGSDRLECSFECRPEEMREDPGLYLGSLAVRIARDLLATLPVSEVYVEGNLGGRRFLGVTFRREHLQRKHLTFRDPSAFVRECGGILETETGPASKKGS